MKGEVLPKPNALPKVIIPNSTNNKPNTIETISPNPLLLFSDLISCFDSNIVINKNCGSIPQVTRFILILTGYNY